MAAAGKSALCKKLVITSLMLESVLRLGDEDSLAVSEFLPSAAVAAHSGKLETKRIEATRSAKVRSVAIDQRLSAIGLLEGQTLYLAHVDCGSEAFDWAVAHTLELQGQELIVQSRLADSLVLGSSDGTDPPFAAATDFELDRLGVPQAARDTVRALSNPRQVFTVGATLSAESIYALDAWAGTGRLPNPPIASEGGGVRYPTQDEYVGDEVDLGSTSGPDANQLALIDESTLSNLLSDELDYLLTSAQQRIVLGNPAGPSKVIGGPGTGETLVAMYRARALAETGKTVLLCAYNKPIAESISAWLTAHCTSDARSRITARNVHSLIVTEVLNPVARRCGEPWLSLVRDDELARRLRRYFDDADCGLSWTLIRNEWREIVLPRSLRSLDEYRGVSRVGLGRRMGARQEEQAWQVYGPLLEDMRKRHEADFRMACRIARERLPELPDRPTFDAVIVDEYQDLHLEELRFVAAVCEDRGLLLLLGDSGQRIYAPQTKLLDAGIDVGRRTHVLRRSYRSTQEVIIVAERVLGSVGRETDADGAPRVPAIASERGRPVEVIRRDGPDGELDAVVQVIRDAATDSVTGSVGVLCLTNSRRNALSDCLHQQGINTGGAVRIETMHRSKGQEFDVVILPGMGEEAFPDPEWIQDEQDARVVGTGDLPRLLHVALSRGRERLVIIHSGELSHHLTPGFARR